MTARINLTHNYADRGLDAYWTPPEVVKALVRIESLPADSQDKARIKFFDWAALYGASLEGERS